MFSHHLSIIHHLHLRLPSHIMQCFPHFSSSTTPSVLFLLFFCCALILFLFVYNHFSSLNHFTKPHNLPLPSFPLLPFPLATRHCVIFPPPRSPSFLLLFPSLAIRLKAAPLVQGNNYLLKTVRRGSLPVLTALPPPTTN